MPAPEYRQVTPSIGPPTPHVRGQGALVRGGQALKRRVRPPNMVVGRRRWLSVARDVTGAGPLTCRRRRTGSAGHPSRSTFPAGINRRSTFFLGISDRTLIVRDVQIFCQRISVCPTRHSCFLVLRRYLRQRPAIPRAVAKSKGQIVMKKTTSTCTSTLLSVSEAAWILGVDASRVCRAIRIGLLPVVRRRGRVLIPAHALAHLADSDDSRGEESQ